ncbi:MAG: hypothetical protein KGL12_10375 [Rhodospirillales bacterium]|nr:hypothetical protein [Rhodospirillales bacterium]
MRIALRRMAALAGLGAMLIGLGGCQYMDPYRRPGMWSPTGANQANLAAMAVNPEDLIQGRGASEGIPAVMVSAPVDRVLADKPKALPDGSQSSGGGGGAGSGGAASGASAGGGS